MLSFFKKKLPPYAMEGFSFIWENSKHFKRIGVLGFFISIFLGFTSGLLPLFTKLETDQLVQKHRVLFGVELQSPFFVLIVIVVTVALIKITNTVVRGIFFYYEKKEQASGVFELSQKARSLSKKIPLGFHKYARNQFLFREIVYNIQYTPKELNRIVQTEIRDLSNLWGMGIGFFILWPWISLLLAVSAYIQYIISRTEQRLNLKIQVVDDHEIRRWRNSVEHALFSEYRNVELSWGAGMLDRDLKKIHKRATANQLAQEKIRFYSESFQFVINQGIWLLLKIIVAFGVYSGTKSVGDAAMVVLYASQFETILWNLAKLPRDLNRVIFETQQIGIFSNLSETHSEWKRELFKEDKIRHIECKDVAFSYPGPAEEEIKFLELSIDFLRRLGESKWEIERLNKQLIQSRKDLKRSNKMVLESVDLDIKAGEIVGLVGKNGEGKTTLVDLITGHFPSYTGSITIDGKEVREINGESLRKYISSIPQEPYMIWWVSLRDNILMGGDEKTDEEIYKVLEALGVREPIEETPKWLESIYGADTNLSGWQAQLLCIARVIIQDRPILILDEATSQLDAENELTVMRSLLKNKKNKLIFFITHRMTTLRHANKIVCLEKGRIVATGKHEELQKGDNPYGRFWRAQVEEALHQKE